MSDITALIDENLERMQVLSQEADVALDGVTRLEQLATSLVENLAGKEQAMFSGFETVGNQLTELNQKLETELQTTKEDLGELRQKAEGIEGQLDQLASQIQTQLGDLKSRAEEMLTEVGSKAGEIQQGLDQLTQQAQEFEADADSLENEAVQGVEELGTTVETTKNKFEGRRVNLMEGFNSLSQEVGEKLQVLQQDFDHLAQESSTQLSQVDTALTTAANETMTAIQEKFNEIGSEITTSAQKLATAFAATGEAGTDDCERMNDKFGETIERSGEAVSVIQEIMPVLEDVEELG